MASQSRKHRGYRSQKVLADYFTTRGWPYAESTGAGRSGSDLTGMPGLAIEVKARSDLQPLAWLKQAEMNEGLPLVIFRPNGMGEESVGKWGCLLRLDTLTELLRGAGYGDSVAPDQAEDAEQEREGETAEERGGEDDHNDRLQEAPETHRLTKRTKKVTHETDGTPR
jgi:hypothetical protein